MARHHKDTNKQVKKTNLDARREISEAHGRGSFNSSEERQRKPSRCSIFDPGFLPDDSSRGAVGQAPDSDILLFPGREIIKCDFHSAAKKTQRKVLKTDLRAERRLGIHTADSCRFKASGIPDVAHRPQRLAPPVSSPLPASPAASQSNAAKSSNSHGESA